MTNKERGPFAIDDPLSMPVRNVVDGWKLRDGNLCLFVRCRDGITREVELRNDPLFCRICQRNTDDPAHVFGCKEKQQ